MIFIFCKQTLPAFKPIFILVSRINNKLKHSTWQTPCNDRSHTPQCGSKTPPLPPLVSRKGNHRNHDLYYNQRGGDLYKYNCRGDLHDSRRDGADRGPWSPLGQGRCISITTLHNNLDIIQDSCAPPKGYAAFRRATAGWVPPLTAARSSVEK